MTEIALSFEELGKVNLFPQLNLSESIPGQLETFGRPLWLTDSERWVTCLERVNNDLQLNSGACITPSTNTQRLPQRRAVCQFRVDSYYFYFH